MVAPDAPAPRPSSEGGSREVASETGVSTGGPWPGGSFAGGLNDLDDEALGEALEGREPLPGLNEGLAPAGDR